MASSSAESWSIVWSFAVRFSCAVMIFRSFDAVSLSVSISLAGVILSDCAGSVRLWDMISN